MCCADWFKNTRRDCSLNSSLSAPVLTIDGPSGTGKGTVGNCIANNRGWHFLDSGALYRAFAFAADERGISPEDTEGINTVKRETEFSFKISLLCRGT